MKVFCSSREILPGLSFFSLKDSLIVEKQMLRRNFESAIVCGVAVRCVWGMPQVLLCRPLHKGKPFPTQLWLTCPYLSYLCGSLESQGEIQKLEEYLRDFVPEYRSYNVKYSLLRISLLSIPERKFLRSRNPKIWDVLRSTGIGGIHARCKPTVKCLHLQTAAYLALPGHPAQKWLKNKFTEMCCTNAQCLKMPC